MTNFKTVAVSARIADLHVRMLCKTPFMVERLQAYVCDFSGEPDVEIDISEQQIAETVAKQAHVDAGLAEYMLSGTAFYNVLFRQHNGFMLHASAIEMDGDGYLFSATSGTGKSTHTQLWNKAFGARVRYINDDKPALRRMENRWYVYGTPWSGKTDLNLNISAPVKAIAFLHRSEVNTIARMENGNCVTHILEQTIRPVTERSVETIFNMLDDLILNVPIYSLGCNVSEDAARLAYENMK